MKILVIGFGGIAQDVLSRLEHDSAVSVSAVLVLPKYVEQTRLKVPDYVEVVSRVEDLQVLPDLAVECAGHSAVLQYGEELLRRKLDLVVISVGALGDTDLLDRLRKAAEAGGSRIILPAGAIAGVDGLAAAAVGGLETVRYTSRKPPRAWRGTPAETMVDLSNVSSEVVLYEGPAGEAVSLYLKNANVAATIALAGVGFAATEVRLIADPSVEGNRHQISARGRFGEMDIEITGQPLPGNPKTSALAAYSVVSAIRRHAGCLC